MDALALNGAAAAAAIGCGRRAPDAGGTQALSVSVVIPTLGRPELLNACLDALSRLSLDEPDGEAPEIVVVDDGPSERTRAIVSGWSDRMASRHMTLRYVASHGPHGPAAARNRGWRAARGHVIAFTDDDTRPDPGWLRAGLEAFRRGAEAAWGRIVMPIPPTPTDYERDANGLERAGFVTANCFCLRTLLARLGGFDERFRVAWREDSDLYFRLVEAGARVVHLPDAVVVHPVRPAAWGVSVRQQRKVAFDALLYKKHPRLYRSRIRARPRWDYYAIAAALGIAVVAAGLGAAGTASVAAALWLAATLALACRRLRGTSKAASHVAEMLVTSALIPPLAVFWRLYGAFRFRTFFV